MELTKGQAVIVLATLVAYFALTLSADFDSSESSSGGGAASMSAIQAACEEFIAENMYATPGEGGLVTRPLCPKSLFCV